MGWQIAIGLMGIFMTLFSGVGIGVLIYHNIILNEKLNWFFITIWFSLIINLLGVVSIFCILINEVC